MKRILLVGTLILLVIAVRQVWHTTASAQAVPMVAVSPGTTDLYLNGTDTGQISLVITGAVEIVGFDVIVTYDDTLMTLDGYSVGGFFSSLSYYCYPPINAVGSTQIVCILFNMESASGDGTLFTLNFTGTTPGTSAIEIQKAQLTNLDEEFIQAVKVNGTINVGYHTNAVSGSVYAQGQRVPAGIPAALGVGPTYGQGPFNAATSPVLGLNLLFPAVVNGDSYNFTTGLPGYLNVGSTLAKTVTVTDSDVTLPPLYLLAGDVTADNIINTADLDAIRDAFGSEGVGLPADINADGVVDVRDLALAAGNYSLTSADAYGGWAP
jgi:hypothetical protein